MLRILTLTTLFPNAEQPSHGIFVRNRLQHLLASGRVAATVVAPVPWFPTTSRRFGDYAAFARVPPRESDRGLEVYHPRFLRIPKVGMTVAPSLLYAGLLRFFASPTIRGIDFDLIDAHYFYPDGVAAAMLARRLGKPLTITARGTDLNLIPRFALPRRQILWAAQRADGLITVCQALKDTLVDLGVAPERVRVLRNGVDLERFQPVDREAARRSLSLTGPTLLSVGHLIERKGHDLIVAALPALASFTLLIAGDGPERERLEAQARRLGVKDRVRFLGRIDHGALAAVYTAADALVLASSREGWANVLLESMACGTPVVASNVWGTPEVVATPEAGVLMAERTPAALADAVRRLFAALPERTATRRYAEGFSWDDTTQGQIDLFSGIVSRRTLV